jgi:hypothetical protein
MSIEDKIDKVLENQGTIIKMLEDVLEAMPDPAQRPDIAAILAPMMTNPVLKDNPAVQQMLGAFMKNMGGK